MTNYENSLNNEASKVYDLIIAIANSKINKMPDILQKVHELFTERFNALSANFILNLIIVKIAQMLTSKRITISEVGKIIIPNWYALFFTPSGYGKDRLNDELNNTVFKNFRLWFKDKAKDIYQKKLEELENIANELYPDERSDVQRRNYIEAEKKNVRPLVLEMQDGTQEGFFLEAKTFSEAGIGSLFLKMSEFGLRLKTSTTDRQNFFDCMYTAYDGVVESKLTKGGYRDEEIRNMPVNMALFSDYTMFLTNGCLKEMFELIMHTGMDRRSVISFQPTAALPYDKYTYDEEERFRAMANHYGEELIRMFYSIKCNSCYVLTEEAKDNCLNAYDRYTTDLYNQTEDELLKKEIKSRVLKVLKLSCLYACLNHCKELVINESDVLQAIYTVEKLSSDIKMFINYTPQQYDIYDKIFNFFKDNLNTAYTMTELKYKYYKQFGLARNTFLKEFDTIMRTVAELADTKGYYLVDTPINKGSGREYMLIKKTEGQSG